MSNQVSIEQELKRSYLEYSLSVIIGRAIPDVRDGLKPVHRRIMFAQHELGNAWKKKKKKIIAEVCDVDEDKITMDSTFKDDLDADSLDVFQIVTAIEDEFELEISDEDAEKIVTVGDAVEQIQNATGNN